MISFRSCEINQDLCDDLSILFSGIIANQISFYGLVLFTEKILKGFIQFDNMFLSLAYKL